MTYNIEILLRILTGFRGAKGAAAANAAAATLAAGGDAAAANAAAAAAAAAQPPAFIGSCTMAELIAYIRSANPAFFTTPADQGYIIQRLTNLSGIADQADIVMTQENVQLDLADGSKVPFLTTLNIAGTLQKVGMGESHVFEWASSRALYGDRSHLANIVYAKNPANITNVRVIPLPDDTTPRCAVAFSLADHPETGSIVFTHLPGGRFQDLEFMTKWNLKFACILAILFAVPDASIIAFDGNSKLYEESNYSHTLLPFRDITLDIPDTYYGEVLSEAVTNTITEASTKTAIKTQMGEPKPNSEFVVLMREVVNNEYFKTLWKAWMYGLDWFLFTCGFTLASRGFFSADDRRLDTSSFRGTVDNFAMFTERASIEGAHVIETAADGTKILASGLGMPPNINALSDHAPVIGTLAGPITVMDPKYLAAYAPKFRSRVGALSMPSFEDCAGNMESYFTAIKSKISERHITPDTRPLVDWDKYYKAYFGRHGIKTNV